jgi:hypothetical protein
MSLYAPNAQVMITAHAQHADATGFCLNQRMADTFAKNAWKMEKFSALPAAS